MTLAGKHLQRGIVIDGQFELERQLGAGGMGTVWAARDMRLDRSVAVKFLSGAFVSDEAARQRFEREARLGGKIRSPHVVQVFSQGVTADHVPFVVMELLDGEDLSQRIARSGPCSLLETGSIIDQVCRGLSRAHQAGLVHRDIKPHNIFLLPEAGSQSFVKLLDFGIAKDVSAKLQSLTVTGSMLGTVLYCSPEQLRDPQSVGPLSDIWALGVVIYEMLTGVAPFDGETLPEVVIKIASGRYQRATLVNPTLPATIDAFFAQVLQTDLALRMRSAEEVNSALAKIVRANTSAVLQRAQPVSRAFPRNCEPMPPTASRPVTSRWPLMILFAILGACAVYYLTSTQGAAEVVRDAPPSAPIEQATQAAIGAAVPVQTTESPSPAKAQSHEQPVPAVQPEPRAPQAQPQDRARVESRAQQRVDPPRVPPTAAGTAPAANSSAPNPAPRRVKPPPRDFGF